MSKKLFKFSIFFILVFVLLLLDQITKRLAIFYLKDEKAFSLINDILELTYVENRGAAFGMLQNKYILFYALTIIVLISLIIYVNRLVLNSHNLFKFIITILIVSGALGNFIDRLKNKYVVDFIYFKLIDFPVFNFADIYISVACILLIISMFTIYKNDL